jgi:hypothetical protein
MLPAATLNGDAGEVVAPAGKPLIAMPTDPLNPFCPEAETVKVKPEPPGAVVIVAGDTPMVKSCAA